LLMVSLPRVHEKVDLRTQQGYASQSFVLFVLGLCAGAEADAEHGQSCQELGHGIPKRPDPGLATGRDELRVYLLARDRESRAVLVASDIKRHDGSHDHRDKRGESWNPRGRSRGAAYGIHTLCPSV